MRAEIFPAPAGARPAKTVVMADKILQSKAALRLAVLTLCILVCFTTQEGYAHSKDWQRRGPNPLGPVSHPEEGPTPPAPGSNVRAIPGLKDTRNHPSRTELNRPELWQLRSLWREDLDDTENNLSSKGLANGNTPSHGPDPTSSEVGYLSLTATPTHQAPLHHTVPPCARLHADKDGTTPREGILGANGLAFAEWEGSANSTSPTALNPRRHMRRGRSYPLNYSLQENGKSASISRAMNSPRMSIEPALRNDYQRFPTARQFLEAPAGAGTDDPGPPSGAPFLAASEVNRAAEVNGGASYNSTHITSRRGAETLDPWPWDFAALTQHCHEGTTLYLAPCLAVPVPPTPPWPSLWPPCMVATGRMLYALDCRVLLALGCVAVRYSAPFLYPKQLDDIDAPHPSTLSIQWQEEKKAAQRHTVLQHALNKFRFTKITYMRLCLGMPRRHWAPLARRMQHQRTNDTSSTHLRQLYHVHLYVSLSIFHHRAEKHTAEREREKKRKQALAAYMAESSRSSAPCGATNSEANHTTSKAPSSGQCQAPAPAPMEDATVGNPDHAPACVGGGQKRSRQPKQAEAASPSQPVPRPPRASADAHLDSLGLRAMWAYRYECGDCLFDSIEHETGIPSVAIRESTINLLRLATAKGDVDAIALLADLGGNELPTPDRVRRYFKLMAQSARASPGTLDAWANLSLLRWVARAINTTTVPGAYSASAR